MKWLARGGWKVPVLLVAVAALVVYLRHGAGRGPRWATEERLLTYEGLRAVPIESSSAASLDHEQSTICATGAKPSFALAPLAGSPLPVVTHVKLRFGPIAGKPDGAPGTPFDPHGFLLHYEPARIVQTHQPVYFPDRYVVRGIYYWRQGEGHVVWHLPKPAARLRLQLPEGAAVRLLALELVGPPPPAPAVGRENLPLVGKLLLMSAVLFLLLLGVQGLWPWAVTTPLVKKLLLITVAIHILTVVFLVPPFMGPDECAHWKAALESYRADARQEVPLYNLLEILQIWHAPFEVPFHPQNQVPAEVLRAASVEQPRDDTPTQVGYAGFASYPVIAVVSLVFPRVETVREALLFYYVCRLLAAGLLLALLWIAHRMDVLPYSALVFFSLPLVLEQSVIISTDVLAIQGTLLAVLLFLRLWRQPSVPGTILLWILCAMVTLSKPPGLAGVFLMPVLLIPFRRIPYKRFTLPIAGLVLLAAAYVGVHKGLEVLEGISNARNLQQQVEFLSTSEGIQRFAQVWRGLLRERLVGNEWFEPLGYVDTELSDYHIDLIYLTVLLAVVFDLVHYGPRLRTMSRSRRLWLIALLVAAALNFLLLHLCSSLIMYLAETPPGANYVVGFQTRYLFPAAVLALFVPLAALEPNEASEGVPLPRRRWASLVPTAALSLFLPVFAARQMELVVDLLVRFW